MTESGGYQEALKRIAKCKKDGADQLDLENLELKELPPHISDLKRLKKLYCWNNQIIDLSPLSALSGLERLGCNWNQITDLSPLSALSGLKELNCGDNQIIDLSPLSALSELERLDCENNPLETPPLEITNQGLEAIKEYFSQENREKISLNEIKVMFIGTGGAGKTTIRQRLCGDQLNPDEQGTQGIEVRRWDTEYQDKKLRLNLWDFAGQEINYSLHELFFTSRTIYVVVLNGREEDTPQKWLEKVATLGGKESKIIIVRNKVDDDGFRVNPNFNFSQLKKQYSGIAPDLLNISAREGGSNFDNFKKVLLEMVSQHPQTSDLYPARYLSIKKKVEEYTAEGKNHINYDTYKRICYNEKMQEPESIKRLLNILSNLGTVTYFDDPELNNIQILNPAWLSGGIYKLLKRAEEDGGVVKLEDFPLILQPSSKEKSQESSWSTTLLATFGKTIKKNQELSWSEHEYPYLLKMLVRYQQGLEIDHNQILIPRGLKSDFHLDFDKTDTLRFRYQYEILPDSIFSKLIVNLFRYCPSRSYGRNSFVLEKTSESRKNRALIEHGSDKSIRLWIGGDQPRSDFFAVIRHIFDLIHGDLQELKFKAYLSLDDEGEDEISLTAAHNWIKEYGEAPYFHAESGKKYNLAKRLGYYNPIVAGRNTAQVNVAGNYIAGDFTGRDRIDDRSQTIIFNQQQLDDLNTFKIFLNEFSALTRSHRNQQQIDSKQRQQINDLTDQVNSMLATKTIPDKTKLRKLLDGAKTIFKGAEKIASLTEKAVKCTPYVLKLIEWLG